MPADGVFDLLGFLARKHVLIQILGVQITPRVIDSLVRLLASMHNKISCLCLLALRSELDNQVLSIIFQHELGRPERLDDEIRKELS